MAPVTILIYVAIAVLLLWAANTFFPAGGYKAPALCICAIALMLWVIFELIKPHILNK